MAPFIAAAVAISATLAQPAADQPRDISPVLEPMLKKHKTPGMAALAIQDGKVVMSGAAGVRIKGKDAKVTIDDRWHIGSCTKSMTATMIGTLVDEGKLSWDSTIGGVFPDLAADMKPGWTDITLRQLCTNRSGVPGEIKPDFWGELWKGEGTPTEQRLQLLKGLGADELAAKPGEKFIYSNSGFSIAGAMAEKVTGKAYEDLMRERLFAPLKMTSAGFGAPGEEGKADQPRGHESGLLSLKAKEPGPGSDNPDAIAPGGKVHCTLEDWAKYVAAHLAAERPEKPAYALLKPETWRALHTPIGDGDGRYAMGWGVTERPWAGGLTLTHSGSNTMWYAVVWMAPKKDFAVLAACNRAGSEGAAACDEACSTLIAEFERAGEADLPAGNK